MPDPRRWQHGTAKSDALQWQRLWSRCTSRRIFLLGTCLSRKLLGPQTQLRSQSQGHSAVSPKWFANLQPAKHRRLKAEILADFGSVAKRPYPQSAQFQNVLQLSTALQIQLVTTAWQNTGRRENSNLGLRLALSIFWGYLSSGANTGSPRREIGDTILGKSKDRENPMTQIATNPRTSPRQTQTQM